MRIKLGLPISLPEIDDLKTVPIITGISTDSRETEAGDLFLALRGERTNGGDHVQEALGRGAAAVISEEKLPDCPCLTVHSVNETIADLAKKYADTVKPKTVAVTGSVGKSTVISYAKTVLSAKFRVHAPSGNHNTDLGLPLTMLAMPADTELLLLEMGARHPGDIRRISLLARPDLAAITNIGSSHLETFGSRNAILHAKTEIVCGMPRNGRLLLNIDDPHLREFAKRSKQPIVTLSADGRAADYTLPKELQKQGTAARYAALFASAMGDLLGIDKGEIAAALSLCTAPPMRQEKIEHGGILYLMDAYNASPESMVAAFELLASYISDGKRTFALLGDMRELGNESRILHKAVGKAYARLGATGLFCYGAEARAIGEGAEADGMARDRIEYFAPEEEAAMIRAICRRLRDGDVLLLKASRAMRLDHILDQLLNRNT